MLKCLEIVKEREIKFIIFESSKFKGTSPENQNWAMEFLTPSFVAAGVQKIAITQPTEVFGKFALTNMVQGGLSLGRIQIKMFITFEEARLWIEEEE
jgi:hypothetical protein